MRDEPLNLSQAQSMQLFVINYTLKGLRYFLPQLYHDFEFPVTHYSASVHVKGFNNSSFTNIQTF